MAKYESLRALFTAIADVLRAKTGGTDAIVAEDFPEFIEGIEPVIEPLTITENGTYTAPDGVDGYSPVTVDVKGSGGAKVASGTFTVAETVDLVALRNDGEYYKIEHGLGVKPTYFAISAIVATGYNAGEYGLMSQVVIERPDSSNDAYNTTIMAGANPGNITTCYKKQNIISDSGTNPIRTEEYVRIELPETATGKYGRLNAGISYTWFAIAEG